MKKKWAILILSWFITGIAFGQYDSTTTDSITTDSFPPSQHLSTADSLRKVAYFEDFKREKQLFLDTLKNLSQIQYKAIPKIDARGLWVNFTYGRSKNQYKNTWRADSSCDCNGIVTYDTVWSNKRFVRTAQIQLAYRLSQRWGIRAGGQLAWLRAEAGEKVGGLNNKAVLLNQNYSYRNVAANLSIEHFIVQTRSRLRNRGFLYGGAGVWCQNTSETELTSDEKTKPGYSEINKIVQKNRIQPFAYMGYRMGIHWQLSYEFGWQQKFFNQVTLSLPLNKSYKKSVEKHLQKAVIWAKTQEILLNQSDAIRRQEQLLFPERFPLPKKVVVPNSDDEGGGGNDGGSNCNGVKS